MIEQLIQWLKDGGENEAANLLADCSLNYLYVDTLFELGGERAYDMFDVNIEVSRTIMKKADESQLLSQQIDRAIRELAQTSSEHIRNVNWVPKLEQSTKTLAEERISNVLSKVDSRFIHSAWDKALSRKDSDPEGAITSARALIESVCKYILDKENVSYPEDADLPKLYHLTATTVRFAPSQYSNRIVKQVLGSCQGVVNGLSSIRNELGDAHGKGQSEIRPEPAHAELTVNLAGAMAIFIFAIWEKAIKDK